MIEVCNLEKKYGDKRVLKGLNFSIDSGEVVGLLGLNGAGKSTTMNIITGYLSPTAGSVRIDGYDIMKEPMKARRLIGYLPEQFAFYPEMLVSEYLDFVCDLKGFSKKKSERSAHIDQICGRVGIAHMRGRMIRNLSKGYRQRVGFAQALIGSPKLLILDEPTVGLDPSQIIDIRNLIRDAGRDSTVIVSSHILHEVQTVCSRVLVLHDGRIAADGEPGKLSGISDTYDRLTIRVRGSEEAVRAALGSTGAELHFLTPRETDACDLRVSGGSGEDIREKIFFTLAEAKLPILRSGGEEHSLEDIFLRLVGSEHSREEDSGDDSRSEA